MNNNKSIESFKDVPDQKSLSNESPHYIPVEINLSQLPFFASDTKGLVGKVTDFKDEVRLSDGSVVPIHWQVSGNTVYGYPSPFAERVFYAIIEIAFEQGYPVQNPIALNMSDICRRLGLERWDGKKEKMVVDSRDRKRVKKAIRSIKAALIVCKGAFRVDGQLKSLDDDGVTLFKRTAFIGESKNGETGEKWTHTAVWLSDFLLKSINARFLRPIDRMVVERLSAKALSSPKIYNYLSYEFAKKIFAKGRKARYVDVAYEKIAVIADIALKTSAEHAKRSFEIAHKALIEEEIITRFKWIGSGSSSEGYKIRYWPGERARREYSEGPRALQRTFQLSLFPKKEDTPSDMVLLRKLLDLGFDSGSAQAILRQYQYSKIDTHLNYLLHNLQTGKSIDNPLGWLRSSLKNNWQEPAGYLSPADREKRSQAQAAKEKEEHDQRIAKAQVEDDELKDRQRLDDALQLAANKGDILAAIEESIRSGFSDFERQWFREREFDFQSPLLISKYYEHLRKYFD